MIKPEWGIKRSCQGCGGRFYDLLKSPILCPKCGTTFELQTSGRGRRGRAAVDVAKAVGLEDSLLVGDIDLVDDLDTDLADDSSLMEDTSELGEDLDDIPDVLDHAGSDDH
ncbi:FYDLN acid domain-containing protein [Candidatus Finniella inopinata]|uniref:TIGR02300 family protein n=1 Tax=Candidatus Finniella inopinata TaxID=1696036 RepID=A0A4Q7DJK9_9PROT|nr:FYDLN acid domain-containing protein [Candidatus Finniella inopinata]RZI47053.1 TIGR02300 family protein [Candidatus Finniella inopinata]